MSELGTVHLLLVSGLAFYVLSSLAVSAALPLILRRTMLWGPASRHRTLVAVGLAPLGLALVAEFSVLLPTLLSLVWPTFDHCIQHDDGHAHLCFTHLSGHESTWLGWLFIGGASAWLIVRLVAELEAMTGAFRLIRRLSRFARTDSELGALVVPTDRSLCLSVGVLRPRLLLSEGLLSSVEDGQLSIMLAHEEAHRRRRDALVRLVVRVATVSLLPASRRLLLTALELASEQACDEEAAHNVGDRLRVAETILAMERRLSKPPAKLSNALTIGFGSGTVAPRVEAMLQPPRQGTPGLPVAVGMCVVLVTAMIASHEEMHHMTESALAFLNH